VRAGRRAEAEADGSPGLRVFCLPRLPPCSGDDRWPLLRELSEGGGHPGGTKREQQTEFPCTHRPLCLGELLQQDPIAAVQTAPESIEGVLGRLRRTDQLFEGLVDVGIRGVLKRFHAAQLPGSSLFGPYRGYRCNRTHSPQHTARTTAVARLGLRTSSG